MVFGSKTSTLTANAAGVATALAFLAEEAEASVLSFTPSLSPFVTSTATFNPTTQDINSSFPFNFIIASNCSSNQAFFGTNDGANGLEGFVQDSSNAFGQGFSLTTADFVAESTGASPIFANGVDQFYLGFSFRLSGSSDAYNLGWVELTYDGSDLGVSQWAYETVAGDSIVTGVVPESSTTALIAGGVALGYLAVRRCKRRA